MNLAEEPPYCFNCVSAVPKVCVVSVSNLLTLCVKLKAAVNHFPPCRHEQNGHQHTQIGGMVKEEIQQEAKDNVVFLSTCHPPF